MKNDEPLCLFPPEVLQDLAAEFKNYFLRKKDRIDISLKQARMLVEYVAGPGHGCGGLKSKSFAQTQGGGGGFVRPTKEQVDAIFNKHYHDLNYEDWDAVFDEVLEKNKMKPDAIKLIHLTFKDNHSMNVICDELYVCPRTFYNRKRIILEQVGVTALKYALLTLANTE